MQSNNLTLETIYESPYPTHPQHYYEAANLIPTKDENLQKQHTETFDKTNYESVKYQFYQILNEHQNEEDLGKLTVGLKKLYKVKTIESF